MSEVLIKAEGVSKKFCKSLKRSMLYGIHDIALSMIGSTPKSDKLRNQEFWAVNDISFELKRGECLGLIGPNGSGKSTLLKMLDGIIEPDKGRIQINGKVGALIEVAAGFHPMLTGRENIYVNGSILGFSKKDMDRKFDAIVDFAELAEFIDTPVKHYSSGMYVRLGFAVAAQMEPDVLLIDEVLAVGDVGFKIKCYNEIYRMVNNAAVIFVSHSMPQVAKICNKGLLLGSGKIKFLNDNLASVIDEYFNLFSFDNFRISGNGQATLEKVSIEPAGCENFLNIQQEKIIVELKYGESVDISFIASLDRSVKRFNVMYSFIDIEQKLVAQCFSNTQVPFFDNNRNGKVKILTRISHMLLNKGKYTVNVTIREVSENGDFHSVLARYDQVAELWVKHNQILGAAPVQLNSYWRVAYF